MRCIAIDDEPKALDIIKKYCDDTPGLEIVKTFQNPLEALYFLQNESYDLVFLDINLPIINGIKLADYVKSNAKIIFTTAFNSYAQESYEKNAADYLLKPIEYKRFLSSIEKITNKTKQEPETTVDGTIFLKSGPQLYKLKKREIIYLLKDGHYVEIFTLEKKILMRMSFDEILKLLDDKSFVQIHKSYLISKHHIVKVERKFVRIAGIKLPIGDKYREHFILNLKDSSL